VEVTRRAARCTRRAARRPSSGRQPRPDDTVCTGGKPTGTTTTVHRPPATGHQRHTYYIVGWLMSRSSVGISIMCYMCVFFVVQSTTPGAPERHTLYECFRPVR
jgi:hypothetical protein